MKNDMRGEVIYPFLFVCLFLVMFSVFRKNVGMAMTCNRYDVMNIMWRKNVRERSAYGGRAEEEEKERESAKLWTDLYGGGGGGGYIYIRDESDLGRGRRLPVPNIPEDERGKPEYPGKKPTSRMPWKYINLDEGYTAVNAEKKRKKKKKKTRERERERDAHTLLHNHARAYTHSCSHNK